jgi:hypothetical protein
MTIYQQIAILSLCIQAAGTVVFIACVTILCVALLPHAKDALKGLKK